MRRKVSRWMSLPRVLMSQLFNDGPDDNYHGGDLCVSVKIFKPLLQNLYNDKLSDLSISIQCQSDCIEEAKECQANCSSQDCTSRCIAELTQCDADCPCNENCPRKVS